MASDEQDSPLEDSNKGCCSPNFKAMLLYSAAALLWALFSFGLNWFSKEQSFAVLMFYSCFWILLLILKPKLVSTWSWIVLWAVTRLCCFVADPFYENDYYRYLWDGLVALELENPLIISPNEVYEEMPAFGLDLENRLDRQTKIDARLEVLPEDERIDLLTKINFPESPSIYGPTAQIFLALQSVPLKLYRVMNPEASIPLEWRIQCLRASFIFIDFLCCLLVLSLLKLLNKPRSWLVLYMLCPVLLKEFGNSLHIDLLSTFFLMLSFLLMVKKYTFTSGMLLALGTGVKMYALVLFPLYLLWTRSPKLFIGFVATMAALYYPFIQTGGQEIWVGTRYFSHLWSMNDFFPALIREVLYRSMETESAWVGIEAYPIGIYERSTVQMISRSISLGCFVAFFIYQSYRAFFKPFTPESQVTTISWVIFAVFWFSPVQNPWYYLWGLPFFVISDRKVILFLVGISQLYLFNFYLEPSSHLFNPFQWWVIAPHCCAGFLWLWLRLKNKEPSGEKLEVQVG